MSRSLWLIDPFDSNWLALLQKNISDWHKSEKISFKKKSPPQNHKKKKNCLKFCVLLVNITRREKKLKLVSPCENPKDKNNFFEHIYIFISICWLFIYQLMAIQSHLFKRLVDHALFAVICWFIWLALLGKEIPQLILTRRKKVEPFK